MDIRTFEDKYRIKEEMRGSFHDKLFEIIDARGLTNKEVYTKSNLDRKQFSKIQCSPRMKPTKRYILALCIGLELDLEESIDLLSRADKAFNPDDFRDQYVMGFIKDEIYDLDFINMFLDERGFEILGM